MQVIYTPENPPIKGVALRIWKVLTDTGLEPYDLHYNFGPRSIEGSGTWACALGGSPTNIVSTLNGVREGEYWCGIHGRTMVYLQAMTAPFTMVRIGFTSRSCPFYIKIYERINNERYYVCKYFTLTKKELKHDCPNDCTNCTNEFLIKRNEEYQQAGNKC